MGPSLIQEPRTEWHHHTPSSPPHLPPFLRYHRIAGPYALHLRDGFLHTAHLSTRLGLIVLRVRWGHLEKLVDYFVEVVLNELGCAPLEGSPHNIVCDYHVNLIHCIT